jgi:hypothetical protein
MNIRTLTSEELSHRLHTTGNVKAKSEAEYFWLDEYRKILLDKLTLNEQDAGTAHNKALAIARTSKEFLTHIEGQREAKEQLHQSRVDYAECDFEIKRRLNLSFAKNREWNAERGNT